MKAERFIEIMVGSFILFALVSFGLLAFKVSGLTGFFPSETYSIAALFDDIGQLKPRAPVKMGGVQIGQVSSIQLDQKTFKALVKMHIEKKYNAIPEDSLASILTAGLLGDNYISITPMYSANFLKDGSFFQDSQSAMVLEKLIGQLIYKLGNNSTEGSNTTHEHENKK